MFGLICLLYGSFLIIISNLLLDKYYYKDVLKYASSSQNLLSCKTSEALGIIQIACNVAQDELKESFKAKYPNLFSGKIGCLKDFELELGEDKDVKPS